MLKQYMVENSLDPKNPPACSRSNTEVLDPTQRKTFPEWRMWTGTAFTGALENIHQIYSATKYILGLGVLQLRCSHKCTLDSRYDMSPQCGGFYTTPLCVDKFCASHFFFDKRKCVLEILKLYNMITPLPHLDSETIQDKVAQQVEINIYHRCSVKGDIGGKGFYCGQATS